MADRSADVAWGAAGAATADAPGIDFLCGPALHGAHADREGRRERVARPGTDTAETVLVVANGERRRHAARCVVAHELVEVIDADGADFSPARPPLGVRADRLEGPELRPRIADVLAGLVTRRVGAAALEEQRTRAPAASDVPEPGVQVLLLQRARPSEARGDRSQVGTTQSVRGTRRRRWRGTRHRRRAGNDEAPVTPLVHDRGIQVERPVRKLRIETDRVTIFDG